MHRARAAAFFLGALLWAATGYTQLPLEFFIPAASSAGKVIRHTGYTLHYNPQHKQADWAVYQLTRSRTEGKSSAPESYRPDPEVTAGAAPGDLQGTGFDRGLLVPAGHLRWSKTAAAEAYLMSNVSPMKTAFRKGLWAELEEMIRIRTVVDEELYIVVGPVLKGALTPAGKSGVTAPQQFFAAILDNREPGIKAVGFILPNGPAKKPLMAHAVSVDEVERVTGLNLFANLPDQVETVFEAKYDPSQWIVDESAPGADSATAAPGGPGQKKMSGKAFAPAVLCRGVDVEGKRCKRMTTNPNGYCWEHQDQDKKGKTPGKK